MTTKTYKRRKDDLKWNLTPSWMDKLMIVLRYFIITTPFIIASIMMFYRPATIWDNWLFTCVYLLALNNIIFTTDK